MKDYVKPIDRVCDNFIERIIYTLNSKLYNNKKLSFTEEFNLYKEKLNNTGGNHE